MISININIVVAAAAAAVVVVRLNERVKGKTSYSNKSFTLQLRLIGPQHRA